jgi:pyruvate dehydrogenase E2 component (dihydrolipoamide acetyltransferase)
MRTAIARLMSTANREIPHYHVTSTLDVERASTWLAEHNASVAPGERILPAAVLLRATALAAVDVAELNGWWTDEHFVAAEGVDLGVAISIRGGGVVTPTIAGADQLTLPELMAALRALVGRSRRGNLRGGDLAPASLTVTNLGDQGAEEVLGVIHPPQVALVGFGRTTDRVMAIDGQPVVRPTVRTTVSGDHRATDGHAGSLLLAAIAKHLNAPEQL